MTRLPLPTELVLVAVVPRPRDLDIARTLGWYRIPLRTAPKLIAADYLAFYQPASFGDRKWRVEILAPILGHELTTRRSLLQDEADHPRADEEYFKIQLGPLIALPSPIQAGGWKRLTFLYTTGAYLLRARRLRDLMVPPEERVFLWRALRDRADQNYLKRSEMSKLPPDADPAELLALLMSHRRSHSLPEKQNARQENFEDENTP